MESNNKKKIKQLAEILKFILTLDDEEITRSSIESVAEELDEIAHEIND